MNEICPAIPGALLHHTDDVEQRKDTDVVGRPIPYTYLANLTGSSVSLLPP